MMACLKLRHEMDVHIHESMGTEAHNSKCMLPLHHEGMHLYEPQEGQVVTLHGTEHQCLTVLSDI